MSGKGAIFLISILALSSFTVLVPFYSSAAEPARVYVDPPSVVNPNVFFNVSIKIDNAVGLGGVQFELRWDPTLLNAVTMTEILFHEVTPESEWNIILRREHVIDDVIGSARYAYHHADINLALQEGYIPISGNHTIAVIEFQVKNVGDCNLSLAVVKLATPDANAIPFAKFDGFFSTDIPPPHLPPLPISDAQVLIYVDPHRVKNESIPVSETFNIGVKLDSVSNHSGLIFVRFGLGWNSSILDCIGVTEVMFHDVLPESEWQDIDWSFSINEASGGLTCAGTFHNIPAAELGAHAIFGNHTLATITFMVKSTGRCGLHLDDCLPLEYSPGASQMLFATRDGYFSNMLNGDLNGDNIVDRSDELELADYFGLYWNGYRWNGGTDITGDQQVNGQPIGLFIAHSSGYGLSGEALALNGDQGGYHWNEEADINGDQLVDIFDAVNLARLVGHAY